MKHRKTIQTSKIGEKDLDDLINDFNAHNTKEKHSNFSFEELIEGLKNEEYKKIVIITGAGISVSSGIPDFRSQGGLYEELGKKYGCNTPEELMTLEKFMEMPEILYSIMNQFLKHEPQPTDCHKFISLLAQKGMLKKYFTQNIDGLEQAAGLSDDLLIQAHGHIRTASCANTLCKKKYTQADLKECIMKEPMETLICSDCQSPVKPDVVLFGEKITIDIMSQVSLITNADLVMVLGTSLRVYPFNLLVNLISQNTPTVLINFEDVVTSRTKLSKFLFLQGDIDTHVRKIVQEAGWALPA